MVLRHINNNSIAVSLAPDVATAKHGIKHIKYIYSISYLGG